MDKIKEAMDKKNTTSNERVAVMGIASDRCRHFRVGDTLVTNRPDGVASFTTAVRFTVGEASFEAQAPLKSLWIVRVG